MLSRSLRVWRAAKGARAVVCLLAAIGVGSPARADERAEAEALFRDGRRLLVQGKLDEACRALSESHRLDPSSGALLNLGDCYERQGRLASAWSEFLAAARLAGARGDRAHSVEGLRRALLLESKLSCLVVRVDPGARGAVIKRDGQVVEAEKLGACFPIDPGEHVITAEATGRATFQASISVGRGGPLSLEVPALAPEARIAAPAPSPRKHALLLGNVAAPAGASAGRPSSSTLTSSRAIAGYAAGGVGVAALAASVAFHDSSKNNHAKVDDICPNDQCEKTVWERATDLHSRGNKQAQASAVSLGLGAAGLLASGCLLLWPNSKEKPRATAARVSLTVAPTPGGLVIGGLF